MTSRFFKPRWMILCGAVFAAAVLGLIVASKHRQDVTFAARVRDAERTVEILRPVVAADPRFRNVSVSMTTGPGVFLVGTVASTNDWEALRRLVEQTPIPYHANLSVSSETKP